MIVAPHLLCGVDADARLGVLAHPLLEEVGLALCHVSQTGEQGRRQPRGMQERDAACALWNGVCLVLPGGR